MNSLQLSLHRRILRHALRNYHNQKWKKIAFALMGGAGLEDVLRRKVIE